jgi:hypothetical protein
MAMDTMDLVGKLAHDTATALGVEISQLDYITPELIYKILSDGTPLIEGMVKYEIVESSPATILRYVDVYNPIFSGPSTAYCAGYAAYYNGQYHCAFGPFAAYRVTLRTRLGTCVNGGNVYRLSF